MEKSISKYMADLRTSLAEIQYRVTIVESLSEAQKDKYDRQLTQIQHEIDILIQFIQEK